MSDSLVIKENSQLVTQPLHLPNSESHLLLRIRRHTSIQHTLSLSLHHQPFQSTAPQTVIMLAKSALTLTAQTNHAYKTSENST